MEDKDPFILHTQYNGWQWLDKTRSKVRISKGIDFVLPVYCGFSTKKVNGYQIRLAYLDFYFLNELNFARCYHVDIAVYIELGRVLHICVGKLTNIGSDNGLLAGWYQGIIWTSAGILINGPWGTNFNDIFIKIEWFSLTKLHLKMPSAKWQPICLSLNMLMVLFVNYLSLSIWFR